MLRYQAPAKLNLFLHITGRRDDGYHDLQTLFQFITLYDELQFELSTDGEIHCQSNHPDLSPSDDLVYKAAYLLKEYSQTSQGADIYTFKYIPMGGGLGGGSSNAATTLLALNHLWQLSLSPETLAELGVQLGADVPIFVHGQSAWAEGVGERLYPADDAPTPWYVVVHPNCHVSTGKIFTHPDLTRDTEVLIMPRFLADIDITDVLALGNDCEALVRDLYPSVDTALNCLAQYAHAQLTGTGACVFAAFETESEAQVAAKACQQHKDWQIWVVRGLNRSPSLR